MNDSSQDVPRKRGRPAMPEADKLKPASIYFTASQHARLETLGHITKTGIGAVVRSIVDDWMTTHPELVQETDSLTQLSSEYTAKLGELGLRIDNNSSLES